MGILKKFLLDYGVFFIGLECIIVWNIEYNSNMENINIVLWKCFVVFSE